MSHDRDRDEPFHRAVRGLLIAMAVCTWLVVGLGCWSASNGNDSAWAMAIGAGVWAVIFPIALIIWEVT